MRAPWATPCAACCARNTRKPTAQALLRFRRYSDHQATAIFEAVFHAVVAVAADAMPQLTADIEVGPPWRPMCTAAAAAAHAHTACRLPTWSGYLCVQVAAGELLLPSHFNVYKRRCAARASTLAGARAARVARAGSARRPPQPG